VPTLFYWGVLTSAPFNVTEKSKVAAAGHFMASYSPLCHCVTVQFSNDEHGGKDLWPPGQYRNGMLLLSVLGFCYPNPNHM
jgi:hypothetical protein